MIQKGKLQLTMPLFLSSPFLMTAITSLYLNKDRQKFGPVSSGSSAFLTCR